MEKTKIMTLENQVIRLELAKKMKELGFKQKSLWWWVEYGDNLEFTNVTSYTQGVDYEPPIKMYSAYTVAELGEMLPSSVVVDDYNCVLFINKIGIVSSRGKWKCYYSSYNGKHGVDGKLSNTLADSMATMLICLKEKGLL